MSQNPPPPTGPSNPAYPGPQGEPSGAPQGGPAAPPPMPQYGAPQGAPAGTPPVPPVPPQGAPQGPPQGPPQGGQYGAPQGSPSGPPPGQQPPKKKGLSTGAIIGIVAGGLVLLLVIAIVIGVVAVRGLMAGSGGSGGSEESGGGSERTASQTVEDYFTALTEGDAETAISLLGTAPDDDTLLTDEVLAASNELAPITDFEIVDDQTSAGSSEVTVAYQLGDTPVTATYSLYDYSEDGSWVLSGGTGSLGVSQFAGLGLTVNGQEADGEVFDVFPGTYELATSLPNFTLTGETVVTSTEPYGSVDTTGIDAGLSDAALTQFRSLVQAAVDACLASTSLTAGCGLDVPATLSDGTQLADGTISRSLSAEGTVTIQSMVPTLSYDNPTLAQGDYIGSVTTTGTCTQNGATGTCSVLFGPSLGRPSIDMASATPTVLWD
ncbi:hypothetical protein ACEXQB_003745 [Herbiconiux sp. P18]|uniref:hypothetical protein n=1 Tax=Herbiconiux liangxiaofengii TaxID=3342795 RepID=UPI0035B8245A